MTETTNSIKLSATRINTFLQCKQKYWFNYYEKYPKVSNPSFRLGTACHEALEFAGNLWKQKQESGSILEGFTKKEKESILKIYKEASVREGIEDQMTHLEGIDLITRRINDFALGREILGLEIPFGFSEENDLVTENGVPLIGAIDKLIEIDDDTLLVVDYKTSKTMPTQDKLTTDIQLSIYDLVVTIKYPQYARVILSLDMLKGDILYTYRNAQARADFLEYLAIVYEQMISMKKEDAKPSVQTLCPWCDFRDYCAAYKDACVKSDYKFSPILTHTDEQLVSEWKSIKSTKKILEERERELSMLLLEKIKKNGSNLVINDEEIYLRQSSRTDYDMSEIARVVPAEDIQYISTINGKSFKAYAEEHPEMRKDLLACSRTNYTSPFLDTRKKKPIIN